MLKAIDCYYFSGTGNTILVLQEIKRVFIAHEINMCFYPIEKESTLRIREGAALCLAIPISSQSTIPFIWKFIKSLPKTNNTPVFTVSTQNESSGLNKPLYSLLKKKGYLPIGYCEINMPNNTSTTGFDEKEYEEKLQNGIFKAREFTFSLISGTSKWELVNSGSSFVSMLTRNTSLPWIAMRLMFPFHASTSQCTQCEICIKSCPVGNIRMDKYPKHLNHCELCMRCISNCPEKAIFIKGKKEFEARKSIYGKPVSMVIL